VNLGDGEQDGHHVLSPETAGGGLCYRGTSLIRNTHPPRDHHRSLSTGLLCLGSYREGGCYERGTPVGKTANPLQ